MCLVRGPVSTMLFIVFVSVCISEEQDENTEEYRRRIIENCLNFGDLWNSFETSMDTFLLEKPIVFRPIPSLLTYKQQSEHGRRFINTIPEESNMDETSGNRRKEGRKKAKKSKKRIKRIYYLLLATAVIAAKASAVATAASIVIPLALKAATLLAAKSLIVGKAAILFASAIGFLKLFHRPTEHRTEFIYDHHHKRLDKRRSLDLPSLTVP